MGPRTSPTSAEVEPFEAHRPRLMRLAYQMLGSIADAQDVVQGTYLRWRRTERSEVREIGAYLARVAGRLCLDRLKSARARREIYVGQWLPEPVIEGSPLVEAGGEEE